MLSNEQDKKRVAEITRVNAQIREDLAAIREGRKMEPPLRMLGYQGWQGLYSEVTKV